MDFMLEWQQRLKLGNYTLKLHVHDGDHVHPGEADGCPYGHINTYPDALIADLHIASNGGDNPDYDAKETILHELLHLALSELLDVTQMHTTPRLTEEAMQIWRDSYESAEERAVQRMTFALTELIEGN